MGQGEEVKTRPEPEVEIQERGEIFFFYRPKVGREEAHGADDVQRLYIVLCPESKRGENEAPTEEKQASDSGKEGTLKERTVENAQKDAPEDEAEGSAPKVENKKDEKGKEGGHGSEVVNLEKQRLLRLIVMGRKSLPDPSQRSRPYWGFVEVVTTRVEDIKTVLKGEEYDTTTRGHRKVAAARAMAEGVYRVLRHQQGRGGSKSTKAHTHLVYKLELPPEGAGDGKSDDGGPQEALNIEREGSFIIQIKNPEQQRDDDGGRGGDGRRGFGGVQSKRRAAFPAGLQGRLGQTRFAPADPPDFLNYEGCELLLISASDDLEEELGLELKTEEAAGRAEDVEADPGACSDLVGMFGEDTTPIKPLLSGVWV